jgi:site-specific DNA-cytosine methylase
MGRPRHKTTAGTSTVLSPNTSRRTGLSPPCSSYSTIGNLQLDSTYDGQLLLKHLEHVVQHVRPLAHNVETVGNAVQVDVGRIRKLLRQAGEQAGYKMFCKCVTPIDHGGVQDRPWCQLIFVREDVVDLCGDFEYPASASTTSAILPRLQDYLDPADEVQCPVGRAAL